MLFLIVNVRIFWRVSGLDLLRVLDKWEEVFLGIFRSVRVVGGFVFNILFFRKFYFLGVLKFR